MIYPPDENVMAAIQEGHFELLGVLFERYHQKAFGLCFQMVRDRSLADDLVQQAFMRVLRYRQGFKMPASFGAWFYRIVRNVCLDQVQAEEREASALARAEWTSPGTDSDASWHAVDDDRIPLVRAALQKLPVDQREALVLKSLHGLTYREIAEQCGASEGAVRVRAHRGLRQLRSLLESTEIEDEEE